MLLAQVEALYQDIPGHGSRLWAKGHSQETFCVEPPSSGSQEYLTGWMRDDL